ncbi:MAG: AI-2E family transporter [Solobacterium sp.]|nr:AI-2E family transporter [Solobacterium sp.]
MKEWNRKEILVTTGMAAAVICLVVLFFFRTSVYTGILSAVLGVFAPFIYGLIIAYLLHPVSTFLERFMYRTGPAVKSESLRSRIRFVAIVLSILLMFGLISLLLRAVIPQLVTSISDLVKQMPEGMARIESWIDSIIKEESAVEIQEILNELTEYLQNYLQTTVLPGLRRVMTSVTSGFTGIISVLKNFLLGVIIAVYLLLSWDKFGLQLKMVNHALFPEKWSAWISEEARFTDEKFSGFIFGKLLDSLIVGVLCFIFMMILRMPYGLLISIIIGITNIIPVFGPFLGAVPATVLILTVSPAKALVFIVFVIILQQVDGNIIGPKILGDRLGLSAFWTLFSIIIFGSIWGIAGMLVGAPLFAVLYDIVRDIILTRLRRKGEEEILTQYEESEGHEAIAREAVRNEKEG